MLIQTIQVAQNEPTTQEVIDSLKHQAANDAANTSAAIKESAHSVQNMGQVIAQVLRDHAETY